MNNLKKTLAIAGAISLCISCTVLPGFRKKFKKFFRTKLKKITTPYAVSRIKTKFIDNFHCVQKGKLYRCQQLDKKGFEKYIKRFKIKTLLNLRGKQPTRKWWQEEKATAQRLGVQFYNIAMTAPYLTPKDQLIKLLDIYDNAPKPILIHCKGGADRTGEASAIWVHEIQKKSKKKAKKQLCMRRRHLKSWYPAKRFLIDIWQGREWLHSENGYDPKNYPQYCKPITAK